MVPLAECERLVDSVRANGTPQQRENFSSLAQNIALDRGQLEKFRRLVEEQRALDRARNRFDRSGLGDVWAADGIDLFIRRRPDLTVARLDSLGPQRVNFFIAKSALDYANAGATENARALLARFETEHLDVSNANVRRHLSETRAAIAFAERRWSDAIAAYKAADAWPDGPTEYCNDSCLPFYLGTIYDSMGVADSAVTMYEAMLAKPPILLRIYESIAPVYERLSILYERLGRREEAATYAQLFIDQWRMADPELQPRVAAIRQLLARVRQGQRDAAEATDRRRH
jgi:tetratricopeptide (TPR) repeat protein